MRRYGWVTVLCAVAVVGCQKSGQGKYTPSGNQARQALEAALAQWRDGQAKPEQFPLDKVKVVVADENWSGGQKLKAFEILGDEAGATGPRVFTVKLTTTKGEQTLKYYVVGIDPLLIYAEPDYRKYFAGT